MKIIIFYFLYWFTETLGGGDYLFAFRMLMVLFRREFSFCDSLYLWEVCSTFLIPLSDFIEFEIYDEMLCKLPDIILLKQYTFP